MNYAGVYRGVVEDNNDPEKRKRYRVRVFMLHPDGVPADALPWAETVLFGGKFFGDLPSLAQGDPVFVMFEAGDRRFPVIIGSFLSASVGVPDAPSEVRANYPETQQRWVRLDRVGNLIEMSPLPRERWIRLASGEATILLKQNDAGIEIRSTSQVSVTAPQVSIDAAEQVTCKTKTLMAQVDEVATIRAAEVVNIQGSDKINIGRYEDELSGALLPKTTDEVDIRANDNIKAESLGTIDVDATSNINVDGQASILVSAQTEINLYGRARTVVRSDGDVEVTAGGKAVVSAVDNVEVSSDQKVIVDSATEVEITSGLAMTVRATAGTLLIDAQAGNVNVTAAGNVNVTAQGTGKVQATGLLELVSSSKIKLSAPIVEILAAATAKLQGTSLVEVVGALIKIG